MDISQPTQAYFREKNRVKQYYKLLKESLSDNEVTILENFMQSENKIVTLEAMRFFEAGFNFGTSLAIETLHQ